MKNLLSLLFVSLFVSFHAIAVDIPSSDGLSEAKAQEFKKQESILKKRGFRLGDNKKNELIKTKIETQEICHNTKFKTGLLKNNKKSVFEYDFIIANNMAAIKDLPPTCLNNFLAQYKSFKAENQKQMVERCRKNYCELVEQAKGQYISNLEDLGVWDNSPNRNPVIIQADNSNCVESSNQPGNTLIAEIQEVAKVLHTTAECVPLNIGETRKVDSRLQGVEQKYTITNLGNNNHRIDLNISFEADNGFANKTAAEKKALDRLKGCMGQVDKNMMDSTGRKLSFNIMSSEEANKLKRSKRPPNAKISLSSLKQSDIRQHSRLYARDVDCKTMVHEMMHLLGLHDEYRESSIGTLTDKVTGEDIHYYNRDYSYNERFKELKKDPNYLNKYTFVPDYQCRTTPDQKTVMNDIGVIDKTLSRQVLCECLDGDRANEKTCRNAKNLVDPNIQMKYLSMKYGIAQQVGNAKFDKFCTFHSPYSKSTRLYRPQDIVNHKYISNLAKGRNYISFTNSYAYIDNVDTPLLYTRSGSCHCANGASECLDLINEISNYSTNEAAANISACPSGMFAKKTVNSAQESIGVSDPNKQIIVFHQPSLPNKALLEPAYVEKILYPKCDSRAKKYLRCIDQSYSKKDVICREKPSYCADGSFLSNI